MKTVSVLLPVYNAADTIGYAIKSILNQTHINFELIIIDDGSTDNSSDVISKIIDSRIKYFYKEHDGLSEALNYGLSLCSNEIVFRMDADDIALPNRLEVQLRVFENCSRNTILSCRYALFSGMNVWGIVKSPTGHNEILKRLPLQNEITHSGVVFNKSFVLENGGYSKQPFEDYELWLRLSTKAEFKIVPEVLMLVLYNNKSLARKGISHQNGLVYSLVTSYFKNFRTYTRFGLNENEIDNVEAWREYFFGNKISARKKLSLCNRSGSYSIKRSIGFLATYLDDNSFIKFKESRLKFRLQSLVNIKFRKMLNTFLRSAIS